MRHVLKSLDESKYQAPATPLATSLESGLWSQDMHLLCETVRKAGALALGYYDRPIERHIKADGTEVSEADFAVDALLREGLLRDRADYGWLSEETEDNCARLKKDRLWIVDPIDGTRAFLRGQTEWVISAALVVDGAPVIAAVFNPVTNEFFEAIRGEGARLNGTPIHVSACRQLAESRIFIPQHMLNDRLWPEPWPKVTPLVANSMAYRLCLVASGDADAVVCLTPKCEWDIVAAHLILEEAGGEMVTHLGELPDYNHILPKYPTILAANPTLLNILSERVAFFAL